MPAQRPQASFNPIPPEFNLRQLVEQTPNFQWVERISCEMLDEQGMDAFDRLVLLHVIKGGKPLVIDGYQSRLDPWTFSPEWLKDNHGDKVENARELNKGQPIPLTIGHYLKNMSRLADQFFHRPDNFQDKNRQRVYLKDIDCPEVWHDKLGEHLPRNLFYLNDSTGDVGGPGATEMITPEGEKQKGRGIAGAGDLMSSLPPPDRAENMMCYIGHEGTYTAAHREMCASLGHNIMVEASDAEAYGRSERPGSSIWFMTESKDRHTVAEYWLSVLGHDIEVEHHFAQIAAWVKAPFTTYIVDQRPGDFILIPPLAPHQVWNRGSRTMKAAWNRTTVETLEMAFSEAIPKARLVCRDEQYKNKAIVFYTLQKYSTLLGKAHDQMQKTPNTSETAILRNSERINKLGKDFKRLFNIYKKLLLSEMFAPKSPERGVQYIPFDSNVTCSYCRCNIFNRFLSCSSCAESLQTEEVEPYDICMDCFVMGRSCKCISKLQWTEQFKWKDLVQKYDKWRQQCVKLDNGVVRDSSPLSLREELLKLRKKTLAQICQEQLKIRPWNDINKPEAPEDEVDDEEEVEVEVNENGTPKRKPRKKKRSQAWLKSHRPCHVCCHRHETWRMAECECGRWWCYGSLFRAHDLMPLEVMENSAWKCPHCEGVCGAGGCRKDPRQTPYQPKCTFLGHETRRIADVRSVESLVDFSVSNLGWLKESVQLPLENERLKSLQEQAEHAKQQDPTLGAAQTVVAGARADENGISYDLIDPSLRTDATTSNGAYFTPANMRNELSFDENEMDEYVADVQADFVAPMAVLYNNNNANHDASRWDSSETTEESGIESDDVTNASKKRSKTSTGKEQGQKKQKKDSLGVGDRLQQEPMRATATQSRKEQKQKALEQARIDGNFIRVKAALERKSKIVKLPIDPAILACYQAAAGLAAITAASPVTNTNRMISENIALPSNLTETGMNTVIRDKPLIRRKRK